MITEEQIKTIEPLELKKRIQVGEQIQVIDIREQEELLICDLKFTDHVPMAVMVEAPERIHKDLPTVFVCRSGKRATALVMTLTRKFKLENLLVLKGGVLGWIEKVDSSLESY